MRWWIDLANAPHVTLFRPLVAELEARGERVLITCWDRGQTVPLTRQVWPEAREVGTAGFRKPLAEKATALWDRSTALLETLREEAVDVALGHNSYSQLLAARRARIPSITMMDYEHQPANHLAFRLADVVMTPTAIPHRRLRYYGAARRKLTQYHGYKEEITLADYVPDPAFRSRLGIGEEPVAVLRPAPEGALYHRHQNTFFELVLDGLAARDTRILLAPRTAGQAQRYAGNPGVTVLSKPVVGADLLYHADVVIGAGGTMTREAAILGTPTWSIFQGRPAAVDRSLMREGKLRVLASLADLEDRPVVKHNRSESLSISRSTINGVLSELLAQAQRLTHRRRQSC